MNIVSGRCCQLKRREKLWVIFALVSAGMNVAVPYTFLKDTGSLLGAFLFWNLITASVLAAGVWVTSPWGRDRTKGELQE
jgi:hypothetical protein